MASLKQPDTTVPTDLVMEETIPPPRLEPRRTRAPLDADDHVCMVCLLVHVPQPCCFGCGCGAEEPGSVRPEESERAT